MPCRKVSRLSSAETNASQSVLMSAAGLSALSLLTPVARIGTSLSKKAAACDASWMLDGVGTALAWLFTVWQIAFAFAAMPARLNPPLLDEPPHAVRLGATIAMSAVTETIDRAFRAHPRSRSAPIRGWIDPTCWVTRWLPARLCRQVGQVAPAAGRDGMAGDASQPT